MATPTNLSEYFQQKGQALPSVSQRRTMFGLGQEYVGEEKQNVALLNKLLSPTPPTNIVTVGPTPVSLPPLPPTPTQISKEPSAADLVIGEIAQPELPAPTDVADTKAYTENMLATLESQKQAALDAYKQQIDTITKQKEESEARIKELEEKQQVTLETDIKPLMEPFREAKETSERERLKVEENYFANQALTGELETLLTGLQNEIKSVEETPGLAVIKSGQISKKKEDVAARVGIINGVMAARNNQINMAYTLIDRSIDAITKDRKDQLSYYESVFNFYEGQKDTEGNKLIQLTKDEKSFIDKQISFLEGEVKVSQDNVDYIKKLLVDPNTALAMAQAGVTLNDSIPDINKKLSDWSYRKEVSDSSNTMEKDGYQALITQEQINAKPADEINWQTDSKGVRRAWWKPKEVKVEDKPLSILDIARYQELYPDAGIVAGDTEKIANEKVVKLSQPKEFTEDELRMAIIDDKNKNTKYEDVLSAIDANTLISNKDSAKQIAAEVYGKKILSPKETEEMRIKKAKEAKEQAEKQGSAGYINEKGEFISISPAEKTTNLVYDFLFK